MANPLDRAGRAIAGLLPYNPGPGIYSRLERAVQAMPENVRVEELPGLLKRYKDGVPGWELKATDLDSVIAGRGVVPREELLARVRERSPVYTHREQILTGTERNYPDKERPIGFMEDAPIGRGEPVGPAVYGKYGQGGDDYTELLLVQPDIWREDFGNHWTSQNLGAVAHARFDTHGDALRINELQSDLGIHNRKMREGKGQMEMLDLDGNQTGAKSDSSPLPFPLEDAWSDLLIKRLALEAAQKGYRAIEIASPRAIADKVGGNIDNYEHAYNKVAAGQLERLGRKMGGLTPDESGVAAERAAGANPEAEGPQYAYHQNFRDQMRAATGEEQLGPQFWRLYSGMRYDSLPPAQQAITYDRFGGSHPVSQAEGGTPQEMYEYLNRLGLSSEQAQRITSEALYVAPHNAQAMHNLALQEQLESVGRLTRKSVGDVSRRYIMSDEMRRRILTEGIPAAVAAGMVSDELIERLGEQ
jgi:hypothetical protein